MRVIFLDKFVARLMGAVFASCCAILGSSFAAAGGAPLQSGESYKIVRQVYLMAVYDSMSDKWRTGNPVRAYLQPERYAKTRWVAYQCNVPVGTVMTIVGPAPPAWDFLSRHDAYYVKLKPNPSKQLELIVQLFRGFSDDSGGLSATFFEPISQVNEDASDEVVDCIETK